MITNCSIKFVIVFEGKNIQDIENKFTIIRKIIEEKFNRIPNGTIDGLCSCFYNKKLYICVETRDNDGEIDINTIYRSGRSSIDIFNPYKDLLDTMMKK
jgi:hypothetical protein